LMETYLSLMSNKMNEVMKVLTVIATIFIPLTFIVGIYGMNFKYMPELGWPWAYFAVWGVMIAVVIIMILYFKRRNWF
jgi:magnesium transporter